MKRTMVFGLALIALAVWGFGCTTVVVKESGPEVLLPGEFVEQQDADIVLVKCSGIGPDQRQAIDNARKGCLEWMITNNLAQSPGERQAYMAQQRAIFANLDRYVNLPPPGARDSKGKGVKSQVRLSDEEIKVIIITDVHKKQLMDDLVAMNVIASKEEMLDAVGRPTLMTVPFPASKGNKYRGMIESLLNSYLTKAKWEVLSASGVADLDKMVDAIGEVAGAEEDEAAKIAMAAGADIYVKFEGLKEAVNETVAYGVRVEAHETTTGRMLAAEKQLSPPRVDWVAGEEQKALDEALNDAMGKVMPQITGYWKEDFAKGRKFYVVFKNAPKNTDMKMDGVMKKTCSQSKLVRSTAKEVVFQVQCKVDNLELASAIDEGITAKMGGTEYEFAAKNRNNIIVVFK